MPRIIIVVAIAVISFGFFKILTRSSAPEARQSASQAETRVEPPPPTESPTETIVEPPIPPPIPVPFSTPEAPSGELWRTGSIPCGNDGCHLKIVLAPKHEKRYPGG